MTSAEELVDHVWRARVQLRDRHTPPHEVVRLAVDLAAATTPEALRASLELAKRNRANSVTLNELTEALDASPEWARAIELGLRRDYIMPMGARYDELASSRQSRHPRRPPTLRLPDEQLQAADAGGFAVLLRRVMVAAELTAGQIAARTPIPRSQCYKLVDEKRTALPTKTEQVTMFLDACRLHPEQVEKILGLLEMLRWKQAREQAEGDTGQHQDAPPNQEKTSPVTVATCTDVALAEKWGDRTLRQLVRHLLRRKNPAGRPLIDYPLRSLVPMLKPAVSVVFLALMIAAVILFMVSALSSATSRPPLLTWSPVGVGTVIGAFFVVYLRSARHFWRNTKKTLGREVNDSHHEHG